MRVIKFYIIFNLVFFANLFSQNNEDFDLKIPDNKIENSNYNSIRLLDIRSDTTNMGFVYGNAFKNTLLVQPTLPLSFQIQNLIKDIPNSKEGELLLQIRKLKFIQRSGKATDNSFFFFRACLYTKEKNAYSKLNYIDTILITPNDHSKNLKDEAAMIIKDFVLKNLIALPNENESYSYFEILKADSIEKTKIKAYNCSEKYTDGIYSSFESFKKQEPDHTNATLIFRRNSLKKIKLKNEVGKKTTLNNKDVFVVIEKGKMYVSAEFGYCTLYKYNGDFYFIGPGIIPRNLAEKILTGVLVPVALLTNPHLLPISAGKPKKGDFEIKVDHIDGSFMRCKQIKTY